MLHLWPRLQAAQEQRNALGSIGPDLESITRFGLVMPDILLNEQGQGQLHLYTPKPDAEIPPFYAETMLGQLRQRPNTLAQNSGLLTASEQRTSGLLAATQHMLQPLQYNGDGFHFTASGIAPQLQNSNYRRATRMELFQAAAIHAEPISRLLETDLINPIRQDTLLPDDPYVQTTLYVIAPFFELLPSATVWPIVARLMERVGRQHITQVVALCATGSYATDLTRSVEDAATYTALLEMEALTGLSQDHQVGTVGTSYLRQDQLRERCAQFDPFLADLVGKPLFDQIYLLDREKSNQSLAEDSHELAIMAGNALEALILANGNLFIEEQMGMGLRIDPQRPYSIMGAASDYVPLSSILYSVSRQEEGRLVREWVLKNSEQMNGEQVEEQPENIEVDGPSLADIGLTQTRALVQLALRFPNLFQDETPNDIRELEVAPNFTLPPAVREDLRGIAPRHWRPAFERHLHEISGYFNLAVGPEAVDETWGLSALETLDDVALGSDARLLPSAVARMRKHLLEVLAASPMGLVEAQQQVQSWRTEVEERRARLQAVSTPSTRELDEMQRRLALRDWATRYGQLNAYLPTFNGILSRAAFALVLVVFLGINYLFWLNQPWNFVQNGAILGGFVIGSLVAGWVAYRSFTARIGRFHRERVNLAQENMTNSLQSYAYDGWSRLHDRLAEQLRAWSLMLSDAAAELNRLSTPSAMPMVIPTNIPTSYLYQAHLNRALWERCLTYLQNRQDTLGQRSDQRLSSMWGQAGWYDRMRQILRREPEPTPVTVAQDWQELPESFQAHTIAEFIRQIVQRSVAPVTLEFPGEVRAELLRGLAQNYSIEHLLWRGQAQADAVERELQALSLNGNAESAANETGDYLKDFQAGHYQEGQFSTSSLRLSNHQYVQSAWNRAKPTANYDVADRMAIYGLTVDFVAASGVTDSDLTQMLLDDFNITLLPTQNPFSITFVRTVHGLSTHDLNSMARYQAELEVLSPEERSLIAVVDG